MGGKVYLKRDLKKKSTSYFSYFLWAAIGLLFLVVVTPLLTKRGAERPVAEKVTPEKGMVMKGIPRSSPDDSPAGESQEGMKLAQEIKETNVESGSAASPSLPPSEPAKPVTVAAQNAPATTTGAIPVQPSPEPGGAAPAGILPGQTQTAALAGPQQHPGQAPPAAGSSQTQQPPTAPMDASAVVAAPKEPTSPKAAPTLQASAPAKPKVAPPPAKPPTAAASSPGGAKYVVQIGSFSQRENADGIQQQLLKKGYEVMVRTITHEKFGRLYIVQLAPVHDATKAESLVTKLKQEAKVQPMVIKLPTDQ